jgi:dipeptidyl aminopeptidase/acylaminoacyl peptidase
VRQRAFSPPEEVVPVPHNVRSRVHEYGGGAYALIAGSIYFVDFDTQAVWVLHPDTDGPRRLTKAKHHRYADVTPDDDGWRLLTVCENQRAEPSRNTIVAIDAVGGLERVGLSPERRWFAGSDFVMAPRPSPAVDGRRMYAWLAWNHPEMPWDGTELRVALGRRPTGSWPDIRRPRSRPVTLAGSRTESVAQPQWDRRAGSLYFISDRSGYWNLYRLPPRMLAIAQHRRARRSKGKVEVRPEAVITGEFEVGSPAWVFGQQDYGLLDDGRVVAIRRAAGSAELAVRETDGTVRPIALDWDSAAEVVATGRDLVAAIVASAREPWQIIAGRVPQDGSPVQWQVVRRSRDESLDPRYVSRPEAIAFETADGSTAHAFYYPPVNPDVTAPEGELPPLRVMTHGGPTSATTTAFNLAIQYWTTRGFAVADVNYRGSSGYGTAYRRALDGKWGIADVEDCEAVVRYLVARGLADPERVAIQGGSAGGYTTLAALTFSDVFKAGASYYGIGDLEALARDTHKFEARYLDRLVAPYPEGRQTYIDRSPIHHTDRLKAPMILFQGSEDKVVPPNQAETMRDAVQARGLEVEYVLFEGEGHGFRKAETIEEAARRELAFYGRVFNFTPAP